MQDLTSLARLQQQNITEKKFGKNENVAVVVTTPDVSTKANDDDLVEALENKFDALRDKLLAEALVKQVRDNYPVILFGSHSIFCCEVHGSVVRVVVQIKVEQNIQINFLLSDLVT